MTFYNVLERAFTLSSERRDRSERAYTHRPPDYCIVSSDRMAFPRCAVDRIEKEANAARESERVLVRGGQREMWQCGAPSGSNGTHAVLTSGLAK